MRRQINRPVLTLETTSLLRVKSYKKGRENLLRFLFRTRFLKVLNLLFERCNSAFRSSVDRFDGRIVVVY